MKLQQNLSVKQQLSQNMVQAASILQMGAQELKEYLQEFAVENPVVDLEQLSLAGNQDLKKEKERRYFEIADTQNRVYYREDRKEEQNYDLSEESEEALQDYFLEQLLYLKVGKEEHRILEYMIFSLDDRGYFVDNMEEICDDLWITLEKGEQMRQILCSMEPKGVGAVSLKECLLLQIDSKEDSALLQMEIIENYLELFGKNQMREIARKTGKSMDEILEACDRIKKLNPKPGNSFGNREYRKYISPDVIVVKLKDYFEVLLNGNQYPSIQINPYYERLLKEGTELETEKYIKEKTDQAKWVQECVRKRNTTMTALVNEIISSQIAFFEYGHGHMKPASQKETAKKLNLHESTVSRALKGKYLQCMWGTYPLHYFFSHGIEKGKDNSQVSAEQIKVVLKQILEEENKKKPYSDRILAEKLEERGFKISRRTVAKYRESLQIGDASRRKIFI